MRIPSLSCAREMIGIEALLVRAYQEKRIDRLPMDPGRFLGMRGPGDIGSNALSRGERVDTSSFGATARARARDALIRLQGAGDSVLAAHDLVLCLDDYFVEADAADPLGFRLWTEAGALDAGLAIVDVERDQARLHPVEIREEAGVRVGSPIIGARLRPVHRIVIAPVIVVAGRSGEPPFVSPVEVDREVPVMSGKRRVGVRPVYVTPLAQIRRERAIYAAWHDAVSSLAAGLAALSDLAVTAPVSPARPWEVRAVAASSVLAARTYPHQASPILLDSDHDAGQAQSSDLRARGAGRRRRPSWG